MNTHHQTKAFVPLCLPACRPLRDFGFGPSASSHDLVFCTQPCQLTLPHLLVKNTHPFEKLNPRVEILTEKSHRT